MEHIIRRCKHCNKEYTYCTYGNGPYYGTEKGCSYDYCAECQNAIDKALSEIPIKCRPYYSVITDEKTIEFLEKKFVEEREKYKMNIKFNCSKLVGDLGFESVEEYTVDWVKYVRGVKKDGTIEILGEKEFDEINKIKTTKFYKDSTNNKKESYQPLSQLKLSNFLVTEKPMEPPTGRIFFDDINI